MSPLPRRLATSSPPPPKPYSSAAIQSLDSDFIVILAALLCALICVLGLVAVARCAWIRRLSRGAAAAEPPSAANKGLKKKVLRSLPRTVYGGEGCDKLSECAICLSEYTAGEEIRVLPQCGHGFHVVCIDTWLGSHSSCPSCRQVLVAARCQKCGGLPAASCGDAASARPQALPRESQISYLP